MPIVEYYLGLNLFWKIVLGVWAFELFCLPFRINLFFRNMNQSIKSLIQETKVNKANFESDDRVLSLLLRVITAPKKDDGGE